MPQRPLSQDMKAPVLDPPNANTMRICVATDNHLGFCKNDAIRKDDSFNSFEEILQIAVREQVDFLLLGGDLFHENKPSRETMVRTINLLTKYCYGSKPIAVEILSDQKHHFPTTGCVNYQNPNCNISLPVFSIHGNHDDPAGIARHSAMDVLHDSYLLNYFGKYDKVDEIVNAPILMKKGKTRVALYGLGNIRDERLHRTFKQGKVTWLRPKEYIDEWFNILTIHQNRTRKSQIQKNYIGERMLGSFFDFVVWGHEHECLIDATESLDGSFHVSQPGSSVATSLCVGEAKEKKIGILEIKNTTEDPANPDVKWKLTKIALTTVRPFRIDDCRLLDELDPNDDNPLLIEEYLQGLVEDMIQICNEESRQKRRAEGKADGPLMLPLIRLRVDYTGGFEKLSAQRFGQQFVGRVANPSQILQFHKQRVVKRSGTGDEEALDFSFLGNDTDETPPIHELVTDILDNDRSLSILSGESLAEAVQNFVEKKETKSIERFLTRSLQEIQLELNKPEYKFESVEALESIIQSKHNRESAIERRQRREIRAASQRAKEERDDGDNDNNIVEKKQRLPGLSDLSDQVDDNDHADNSSGSAGRKKRGKQAKNTGNKTKKTRTDKTKNKSQKKQGKVSRNSKAEEMDISGEDCDDNNNDDDDDDNDDDYVEKKNTKRSSGTTSRTKQKQQTIADVFSRGKKLQSKKVKVKHEKHDNDDVMILNSEEEEPEQVKRAVRSDKDKGRRRRKGTRKQVQEKEEEEEEEEEEEAKKSKVRVRPRRRLLPAGFVSHREAKDYKGSDHDDEDGFDDWVGDKRRMKEEEEEEEMLSLNVAQSKRKRRSSKRISSSSSSSANKRKIVMSEEDEDENGDHDDDKDDDKSAKTRRTSRRRRKKVMISLDQSENDDEDEDDGYDSEGLEQNSKPNLATTFGKKRRTRRG